MNTPDKANSSAEKATPTKTVANKKQFSQMMQERHATLTRAYMDSEIFSSAPKTRQQKDTQKSREPEAKQRDQ